MEKEEGKKEDAEEVTELEEIIEEDKEVLKKIKFLTNETLQVENKSPVLNKNLTQQQTVTQAAARIKLEETAEEAPITKKENGFKYESEEKEEGDGTKYFERKNNEGADYIGGRVNNETLRKMDTLSIGRELQTDSPGRNVAAVHSMPQTNSSTEYETTRDAERMDTAQIGREDPFKTEVKKYEERPHY